MLVVGGGEAAERNSGEGREDEMGKRRLEEPLAV